MSKREIWCDACLGDRGFEVVTGHDPNGPVTRWDNCAACDGKGVVVVEFEPITIEDLDHAGN